MSFLQQKAELDYLFSSKEAEALQFPYLVHDHHLAFSPLSTTHSKNITNINNICNSPHSSQQQRQQHSQKILRHGFQPHTCVASQTHLVSASRPVPMPQKPPLSTSTQSSPPPPPSLTPQQDQKHEKQQLNTKNFASAVSGLPVGEEDYPSFFTIHAEQEQMQQQLQQQHNEEGQVPSHVHAHAQGQGLHDGLQYISDFLAEKSHSLYSTSAADSFLNECFSLNSIHDMDDDGNSNRNHLKSDTTAHFFAHVHADDDTAIVATTDDDDYQLEKQPEDRQQVQTVHKKDANMMNHRNHVNSDEDGQSHQSCQCHQSYQFHQSSSSSSNPIPDSTSQVQPSVQPSVKPSQPKALSSAAKKRIYRRNETPEQKRKRLHRNRLISMRWRANKKNKMEQLEQENIRLTEENDDLHEKIKLLEAKILLLEANH